jgi:aspartyl-tRNA(Asn)/glutamyl-tRNA(Gln) amidotransferase subunit A
MTELGMTPTGASPKRKLPRNPHATDCLAGGSSTGSAVAVATGLVPFALGADGGGSIRIPASLCGIFGLKPTWGRVSRDLAAGGTVAHIGPLASSVLDLARVLDVEGGEDPADRETRWAPACAFQQFERSLSRGVRGLVIGVDEAEWADASPGVAKAGQEALRALEKEGARLEKVTLSLARFAAAIGYVAITVESRAFLSREWRDRADELGHDLQISFATLDAITAPEAFDAMRLRAGLRREIAQAMQGLDLLALPTTVDTAARVTDAEMTGGFMDAELIDGLCRFNFLGNLTGLPAGSAPVGLDAAGRPIGLQLVGDAWDEATVLAAMAHLERLGVAKVARPRVAVDMLPHHS